MATFSNFLIKEAIRQDHAERYVSFITKHRSEVLDRLIRDLTRRWEILSSDLNRQPISQGSIDELLLTNPDALTAAKVNPRFEKVWASRTQTAITVCPSLCLPLCWEPIVINRAIDKALQVAKDELESAALSCREVFVHELKGRLTTSFRVLVDEDEVKFQLRVSDRDVEAYKTIFVVRVDRGSRKSKSRGFVRVYLHSV